MWIRLFRSLPRPADERPGVHHPTSICFRGISPQRLLCVGECAKCGYGEESVAVCDPLRSNAVGWTEGELKPPN